MASRKGKAAAPKKTSNIIGDDARRTARIRKPASKAQLNARFESGSRASSRQASRNASRRRRSPPLPSRSSRPSSSSSSEGQERQSEESMQDTALGNEAAALRLRARAVAKEITARKQVAAARESLAAQELQLQNMTMGDTRAPSRHYSISSTYNGHGGLQDLCLYQAVLSRVRHSRYPDRSG